jgi:hypothetical protein
MAGAACDERTPNAPPPPGPKRVAAALGLSSFTLTRFPVSYIRGLYGRLAQLTIPTYPALDGEPPFDVPNSTYFYYRWSGWWSFVQNIFDRPELPATQHPRPASLRASRAFEGSLRIVPLSYLDDAEFPVDYPIVNDDTNELAEQQELEGRLWGKTPLVVQLPASGPPIISQAAGSSGVRLDLCRVAAARITGLLEIPVRVFYV